ncbi:hypothetical protein F2P81_005260 [Scophthalmus maximus]|uniref:Uncharacterized protein n=1 Tax=Scophthalmus maximus TaxID=52904 RepID=A0A6A4TBC3_SCOMX|nr:hypothetical protein F2P81_005260 [Scophthalmus maximus]
MRDMGGKEKTILVIANVPNYRGSDKKTLCSDPASARKNGKLPPLAVPPPMPMSPIVEKMEGLKAIRNRSNSLRLGRLAFYRHLEKVETMRCFWELKHVELEGGNHQFIKTAGQQQNSGFLFRIKNNEKPVALSELNSSAKDIKILGRGRQTGGDRRETDEAVQVEDDGEERRLHHGEFPEG